jgi:hypothetical protein
MTANTVVLFEFNGSNGSTTFTNSANANNSCAGYNGAKIFTSQQNTAVSFFYGDGDAYVDAAYNSSFDINTKPFTWQGWVYLNENATNGTFLINRASPTYYLNNEQNLYVNNTAIDFYWGTRGSFQAHVYIPSPITLNMREWIHVVFQRDSTSNVAAYFNGVRGTQYQYSPPQGGVSYGALTNGLLNLNVDLQSSSGHPVTCGAFRAHPTLGYCKAFFKDVEYIVGEALYTDSFTPPPTPPDPILEYFSLTPQTGYANGNTSFVLVGRAFNQNTTVKFDGVDVPITISNSHYISGNTPPHSIGYANLSIMNP